MFTGLVEKTGKVKRISRGRGLVLEISFEPWAEHLVLGESVAVNGVCLTVADCDNTRFTADVLRETESRTGLGELKPGDKVNLERAMKAGARLGGHIVQGHVDGRGVLVAKTPKGRDFSLTFRCGRVIACGCVEKGSIAVNGVSLTVSGLGDDWFRVDVIPTTLKETNLGLLNIGDSVNLETDVLGKYARKGFSEETEVNDGQSDGGGGLTMQMLVENGFA
ncbi:MAG: riboflavin synthase [Kiritimatiellae bacterium]|nr:riboflavin synthase [Kiritimatiellia bacterium]